MYDIELFYDIFGEDRFYEEYIEYKNSFYEISNCKNEFGVIESDIARHIKTKKEYDKLVEKFREYQYKVDTFLETDIQDVRNMTIKEIREEIDKYFIGLGSDVNVCDLSDEINSLAISIHDFNKNL